MNCSFVVDASYPLFLYMLYAPEEMLENTSYYVGKTLSELPLPHKMVMPPFPKYTEWEMFKYRARCFFKYRKVLKRSQIFAQDHLFYSAPLIDNLPYTCVEDCPNFFLIREQRNEVKYDDTLRSRLYHLELGRIYQRYAGNNPYCTRRLITSPEDAALFERQGYSYELVSLQLLWDAASSKKRQYILDAYNLKDIANITKRDVVLFSQPLVQDAHMSEQEVANLFKASIERYGAENILVKMHPRDTLDYQKFFPGVAVLKTKAPQQLFNVMGVKYKAAITCCSSAVSSMGEDCEVVWLGAEVDDRIVQAYGHIKKPIIKS